MWNLLLRKICCWRSGATSTGSLRGTMGRSLYMFQ
jgi:hypothetical protein